MKYRKLNSINKEVSELSLGTFPFKGWWGEPLSDQKVIEIVDHAVKLGVNLIDTADVYGLGEVETILGNLDVKLKSKIIISTKGGRDFTTEPGKIKKNFDVKYLEYAINESLRRLNLRSLEIYFLHGPEKETIEDGKIFDFIDGVKSKGLAKSVGISVNEESEIDLILEKYSPDLISIDYNYLSDININAISEKLSSRNIDLIVREPFAQGLLTGKYNERSVFPSTDHRSWKWTKEFWHSNSDKLMRFDKVNPTIGDKIHTAFSTILKYPSVKTVIFGVKSAEQLEQNLELFADN